MLRCQCACNWKRRRESHPGFDEANERQPISMAHSTLARRTAVVRWCGMHYAQQPRLRVCCVLYMTTCTQAHTRSGQAVPLSESFFKRIECHIANVGRHQRRAQPSAASDVNAASLARVSPRRSQLFCCCYLPLTCRVRVDSQRTTHAINIACVV